MTHQRVYCGDLSCISGLSWLSNCWWSHLQAGDGEAASVVRQRGDGDDERRVGDVLIVKLDGNLVVTWREGVTAKNMMMMKFTDISCCSVAQWCSTGFHSWPAVFRMLHFNPTTKQTLFLCSSPLSDLWRFKSEFLVIISGFVLLHLPWESWILT